MNNSTLIDKTVEITVARMSNTGITVDANGGKSVADFMQAVYDKLFELNSKER